MSSSSKANVSASNVIYNQHIKTHIVQTAGTQVSYFESKKQSVFYLIAALLRLSSDQDMAHSGLWE